MNHVYVSCVTPDGLGIKMTLKGRRLWHAIITQWMTVQFKVFPLWDREKKTINPLGATTQQRWHTGSRQNTEVKQHWRWSPLGWVKACRVENYVLLSQNWSTRCQYNVTECRKGPVLWPLLRVRHLNNCLSSTADTTCRELVVKPGYQPTL